MSALQDVAQTLLEAERPLNGLYRQLREAAVTRVEHELAGHLDAAQATQAAYLELMCDQLPNRFVALGEITSDAVKLRPKPGGSQPVLEHLPVGTPVIVMAWEGYWAQVQLPGGRRGFVFRDYVRAQQGTGSEPSAWERPG